MHQPALRRFSIKITTPDDDATNDAVDDLVGAYPIAEGLDVHLELKTDNYAEETTWKLFDGDGTVVAQDPPGNYADATVYHYDWVLQADECYLFEIYDSLGDGICCMYGQGYYKLLVNGVQFIGGSVFWGPVDARPFNSDVVTGMEDVDRTSSLSIYPNPTNDGMVRMDFGRSAQAAVSVFNVLGEQVMSQTFNTTGVQDLDLHGLTNGIYYVTVLADGKIATGAVTVNQ